MSKRPPKPPTPLAAARINKGITQSDLATLLGMKQPSYSAIERRLVVPDVVKAQRIASIVGRSGAELWPSLDGEVRP